MNILKPSFAKIFSTPVITLPLFILLTLLDDFIFGGTGSLIIILVLSLLIAYFLSSLVWTYGKNHRRILIVVFALLAAVMYNFIFSLLASFFGLSITDLGLPCGGSLSPCHPHQYPTQNPVSSILFFISIVVPLTSLVIGIIAFIKEGRKSGDKVKK